jgi:hypothetical protein
LWGSLIMIYWGPSHLSPTLIWTKIVLLICRLISMKDGRRLHFCNDYEMLELNKYSNIHCFEKHFPVIDQRYLYGIPGRCNRNNHSPQWSQHREVKPAYASLGSYVPVQFQNAMYTSKTQSAFMAETLLFAFFLPQWKHCHNPSTTWAHSRLWLRPGLYCLALSSTEYSGISIARSPGDNENTSRNREFEEWNEHLKWPMMGPL